MTVLARYARTIDAATPAGRDRTVDVLRALAIAGVILGHWLVTALVLTRSPAGERLHDSSPLAALPALAPVSWVFQTLAIFFFVGGYSAARSFKGSYLTWLRARLGRLGRPGLVLAGVWVPLTAAMILAGVRSATIHTIVTLVLSPLWFLAVFAGLTALTRWRQRWSAGSVPPPRSPRPPWWPGWTPPVSASAVPPGSAG